MFPAISLLQLREAAENVSASSSTSSLSVSSSPPPTPALAPSSILPQLPFAPFLPIEDDPVPLCLSTAICFRAHSVLSRPPPTREEKAQSSVPIFSPSMVRIGVELKRQSPLLLPSAPSPPTFPAPCSDASHVGSFAIVVHLDTNKLSSSCIIHRSSLKCVEVRTLLACVVDVVNCSTSPLAASLPVTLLFRPYDASTPLHLLTVRTASTAPTRDCVQLASDGVYECEILVQCDSGDSDDGMVQICDVALDVVSVELCQGPSMEYCERVHWWPALSDTQRRGLLPWVLEESRSEEKRQQQHLRKREESEHKRKRKHSSRTRRRAHKHKHKGSHKRHRVSEDEADNGREDEEEQPAVTASTLPTARLSESPSHSSSSSSSSSLSPTCSSSMRYPPCCTCGVRTTCTRSKYCGCVAAGQRCGHCASDFCENEPKTMPHQRTTIVSRQVVQQYQREMRQQRGMEEARKERQHERVGAGKRLDGHEMEMRESSESASEHEQKPGKKRS